MTCPICKGKHVIFITDEFGEDIASPCSCLADARAESLLKSLQQKGAIVLEDHYLANFGYSGSDKEKKDSLLKRIPLNKNLWIWGGPKTQKTSFAVLIMKKLSGAGIPVDYITMGDLNRIIYSNSAFLQKDNDPLAHYREIETLVIDDVYGDKYVTFSAGTQNQYWSDFVASRKHPTIFISQYHPASPPSNWDSVILDVDKMEIEAFNYTNIDDMPDFNAPKRRKVLHEG